MQNFAYLSLGLTILGLAMVAILHYRKSKLCKGHIFSNTMKIIIFISDVQIIYLPNYAKLQVASICSKLQAC